MPAPSSASDCGVSLPGVTPLGLALLDETERLGIDLNVVRRCEIVARPLYPLWMVGLLLRILIFFF